MNLKKTLKRKFYLKYFTLVFLLLLYVPIIGLIVTQFAYKDYFMHFFITFIVMFAIAILLNIIYEKRFGLPQISNIRDLTNYLEYFSSSTISDLEYTESITWFSRIIHSAYLQKAETQHKEMLFWTKEEYKKFSFEMMDKPVSFYAFEMLYWCGIREGELLALTAADFDFEKETVRVNKSYQRLHGEDVITTPKTKKSNRIIKMPKFLCEEMQEYLQMLYGLKKKDRIFTVTKSYLYHEMDRGAKAAGVKRIRIHDLRHSHISLLIDMGFSAVAIADRVGHESIDITYQYAHLFPSKQTEMADRLDDLGKGEIENVS